MCLLSHLPLIIDRGAQRSSVSVFCFFQELDFSRQAENSLNYSDCCWHCLVVTTHSSTQEGTCDDMLLPCPLIVSVPTISF